MIPGCIVLPGAPYPVLPPGIHWADLSEIEARFGRTRHRQWLYDGLSRVAEALGAAGCQRMYVNGSFVTEKQHPRDYDGCWDPTNVDVNRLDPVLLDFSNKRLLQKKKYGGEMFILGIGPVGSSFLDFFQTDKATGRRKGIVGVQLHPKGNAR